MRNLSCSGVAAFALMLVTGVASQAQWITFTDETGARLELESFSGELFLDPMLDPEEKDIAVGDLDRDGVMDLVIARKVPFSNEGPRQDVLLMNEAGVLVDRTATLAPGFITTISDSRDVYIGDFTGDDWPDVVFANTFGQQPSFYRNLGNDEKGDWQGLVDESSTRFPTLTIPGDVGNLLFCGVEGGDVTGDDSPDLFFSNYELSFDGNYDVLFVNDGTGYFTNETVSRLGAYADVAFGSGAEIHDVDNDGDNDIIKISTLYSNDPFPLGQFILFNDGDGIFDNIEFQEMPTVSPYMFAAGYLNDDNLLDFLSQGDAQDRVSIATSVVPDSVVNFTTTELSPSPRTTGLGGNTKLADVDGDGDLDAAIASTDVDIGNCGVNAELALLENPGDGQLFDPWGTDNDQNFHVEAHDIEFLDVNNDGCLDFFVAKCTGWHVFIQDECNVEPDCDPLTLSHTGSGSDPVASPTNSEGCDPGEYLDGEVVSLSGAIPDEDWVIAGWSGTSADGSTASTNSVTVPDAPHEVIVHYELESGLPDHLVVRDRALVETETFLACQTITVESTVDVTALSPGVLMRAPTILWEASSVASDAKLILDSSRPLGCPILPN